MIRPEPVRPTGSPATIHTVAHLAVPTGTAAATVIATDPFADPVIEARRFARLVCCPDIELRAQVEELIVHGVYTVLHGRLLVVRVIHGGTRRFAVVAAVAGSGEVPYPRAGLHWKPTSASIATDAAEQTGLQELVEAEARQRPIFHGVTPQGVTYSGFAVVQADPVLAALNAAVALCSPKSALTVFAIGEPIDFPDGLVIGVERAQE